MKLFSITDGQGSFTLLAIENDVVIKRVEYKVKNDVNPYKIAEYVDSKIYINEKISHRGFPTLNEISKEEATELVNFYNQNKDSYKTFKESNFIVEERSMFNKTYPEIKTLSHYNNIIKKF